MSTLLIQQRRREYILTEQASRPTGTYSTPITASYQLTAGNEDAEEYVSGGLVLPFAGNDSSDLEFFYTSRDVGGFPDEQLNQHQIVGLSFVNPGIPTGSLISNTYVQFTCDEVGNSGIVNATIRGELTGSASVFPGTIGDISDRTRTNTAVLWQIPEWNSVGARTENERTVNISKIIQEIVDQPTYTTSSRFNLIFNGDNETTKSRWAEAYDGVPASAPEIFITYHTASVTIGERKHEIIIQSSQVTSSLTDFPVLITADNLNSEVIDAGIYSAQSNGDDIIFTSDSSGSTRLPIDIVEFTPNASTGSRKCEIWVKVPSISSTVDTSIWIWYNDDTRTQPSVSASYGRNAVWTGNDAVYHLNEDPSGTAPQIIDYTGNLNEGTSAGSMATGDLITGQIANALNFDGADDYINVPYNASLVRSSDWMFSFWHKTQGGWDTNSVGDSSIFSVGAGSPDSNTSSSYAMFQLGVGEGSDDDNGRLRFGTYGGNIQTATATWTADTWYHVAVRFIGSSEAYIYVNGAYDNFGGDTNPGAIDGTENLPLTIGKGWNDGTNEGFYSGSIDELKFYNTSASAGWVNAEYNNQSNPSAFATTQTPQSATFLGAAELFIDAVGTLTTAEETAIRNLVDGLEANGTWDKYHAIYPLIGGTASEHKWNLKDPQDTDAAFRITWNGGVTHDADGVTFNGSTGYGNTHLLPNTTLSSISYSFGVYYGTMPMENTGDGVKDGTGFFTLYPFYGSDDFYAYLGATSNDVRVLDTTRLPAMYAMTQNSGTVGKAFENGLQLGTTATGSNVTAFETILEPMYIGAVNRDGTVGELSTRNEKFWFIADGLTDQEIADDYTVIEAYQLELGRSVITQNLQNYWKFNGDGTDAVGGLTATLTGDSIFTGTGKFNQAYEGDGTDGYATVADDASLSFGNGTTDSPFSLSGFVYWDGFGAGEPVTYLIDKGNYEYRFYIDGGGKFNFNLYDTSTNRLDSRGTTAINTGTWYHFVATYDGSGSETGLNIYLNGVNDTDTRTEVGTYVAMPNTALGLGFGVFYQFAPAYELDGKLQNIGIWDKELSALEAEIIYAKENGEAYLI